jgi:hypothetical protein
MPRRISLFLFACLLAIGAVAACNSSIQYPGQLVGSFDTTLVPASSNCIYFLALPGFCPDTGELGPCSDGGIPDAGTTVLVVSTTASDAGYVSYQSGSQSSTANGSWDGQTVQTQAVAQRFFLLNNQPSADAGCIAQVTETIVFSIYATLDGGCDGGIPSGPPPTQIGGVYQTQVSPACGILVDNVVPDTSGLCCADPITDGGVCGTPPPPNCTVSFGLVGQGRSSPP